MNMAPGRKDLAVYFGEAANRQRGKLIGVHFHAAIGRRRDLVGEL